MNHGFALETGIKELGLELPQIAQQKMLSFLGLLQKWNKVYNLTAIRDKDQMISHHLLDSLVVLPHLWAGHWLDVGCGAGLPGLILAIARPDWEFTLIDSNSKKTSFVKQAIIELGLKNAIVTCSRVEEFNSEIRFDGIISRAFAETGEFVKLTRHLLAENGKWAAMKGMPEQELLYLPEDVLVDHVIPLRVSGLNAERCLVILKAI